MRKFLVLPFAALLPLISGCAHRPDPWVSGRWVDLTHPFAADTIYWPTSERFRLDPVFDGTTEQGYHYAANRFCAAEHGGTHLDAPIHFAAGGESVEQLGLEKLIGPAVVIDVTARSSTDRDYRVRVADFQEWESRHGPLAPDSIVLLRTGYEAFWPDASRYLGTAQRGEEAVAQLHFPGLHPEAARWLAEHRRIKAIGLDTASIDYGQSKLFESHRILSARGIPIFENAAHLDRLPARGAVVIALPMDIRGGSGAPLRLVAWLPDGSP